MQFLQIKSAANRSVSSVFALLGIAMIAVSFTGCTPLVMSKANEGVVSKAATSAGQYQLRMEMPFGKSETYIGDIDGPLTIQNALERSGAMKKFRAMDVDLFREVEGTYAPLKMTAVFEPGKKMIRPETNYGLRAGDSILVKPASNNPFGKMLGKMAN